jgi:hypothetical protein
VQIEGFEDEEKRSDGMVKALDDQPSYSVGRKAR